MGDATVWDCCGTGGSAGLPSTKPSAKEDLHPDVGMLGKETLCLLILKALLLLRVIHFVHKLLVVAMHMACPPAKKNRFAPVGDVDIANAHSSSMPAGTLNTTKF